MMDIDLSLKQETTLSPQMQQFFAILQANNQELSQLITQQINTNPVLEYQSDKIDSTTNLDDFVEDEQSLANTNGDLDMQDEAMMDWGDVDGEAREYEIMHHSPSSPSFTNDSADLTSTEEAAHRHDFAYASLSAEKSLQEHLIQQVQSLALDPIVLENCLYLIGCLDDRGYFEETADYLAKHTPDPDYFDIALATIRDLDPVGVGAFDLQNCLLIQLEQAIGSLDVTNNSVDKTTIELAYKIIKHEFKKLSKHQYAQLIKDLEINHESLDLSLGLIRSLSPAPGLVYQVNTNTELLLPDINLEWKEDGSYRLKLDNELVPPLMINQQYKQLALNRQESDESKKFLKEQVQDARFWLYAIAKRQETLLAITKIIVETQLDYLKGIGPLQPLSMQDIASALDIHQTTVSRSIFSKSLQIGEHIYPLKSLLSKAYELKSGEQVALDTILTKIKHFINKEDPASPISDKKIAELLDQVGYDIPVRTVSHYREKIGFLPAHLRTTTLK